MYYKSSLSDENPKQGASFIKSWTTEWSLLFQNREKIFQADTVLLSNCVWDGFKYILNGESFFKYKWIIPSNNQKTEIIKPHAYENDWNLQSLFNIN